MKVFKQILVITDNPKIASRFEKEVWHQENLNNFKLSFKCSPFTNSEDFKLENPVHSIDLRNNFQLESITHYDLIISIHCKQLFPIKLIQEVKCINVHPGYNPVNRGWYPQVFAIINDFEVGATIHEIDKEIDNGKIIVREKVMKYQYDTSITLYNRIIDKEIDLLKKNIRNILMDNYKSFEPENEGNLFVKKDFNKLCSINLNEKTTMRNAINKLRALTHGEFKNAYFFDQNGKKIFISIDLTYEE